MIQRLAVIGDLHGEHDRLARVLEWLHGQQLDAVVCTGDVADGRGCINLCCDLLSDAEVDTVAGNHDRWLLDDRVRHVPEAHVRGELSARSREFLEGLPRQIECSTVLGRLLLCHGVADNDLAKVWPGTHRTASQRNTDLDQLLDDGEYRFLINGHMHFRVLIDFSNMLLVNAGTLKGERGGISMVDFAGGAVTAFEVGDAGAPERVSEYALDAERRRVWRDTQEFDGNWTPAMLYA